MRRHRAERNFLILGAGIYQLPLIERVQARGMRALVLSRPGPYPGIAIADEFRPVDTTDARAILEIARRKRICGIATTGTDVCVPALGSVAESLGLAGPGSACGRIASSKLLMKRAFERNGVPTARFHVATDSAQAADALGNLEAADEIQARRLTIWNAYDTALADWAERHGIRRPHSPQHCDHPAHMYHLRFPNLAERTAFIDHLAGRGVKAVFHYLPLHLSEFGRRYGLEAGSCPVTETVSDELVRLPLFFDLTDESVSRIVEACRDFEPRIHQA